MQAMTTLQITLPDDLARKAGAAGLFAPETIAAMLRERLQKQDGLRDFWARLPQEELTPAIEQEIVAEVKAYRAERRKRAASH